MENKKLAIRGCLELKEYFQSRLKDIELNKYLITQMNQFMRR